LFLALLNLVQHIALLDSGDHIDAALMAFAFE
jgi:hypothetical protein